MSIKHQQQHRQSDRQSRDAPTLWNACLGCRKPLPTESGQDRQRQRSEGQELGRITKQRETRQHPRHQAVEAAGPVGEEFIDSIEPLNRVVRPEQGRRAWQPASEPERSTEPTERGGHGTDRDEREPGPPGRCATIARPVRERTRAPQARRASRSGRRCRERASRADAPPPGGSAPGSTVSGSRVRTAPKRRAKGPQPAGTVRRRPRVDRHAARSSSMRGP